MLKTIIDHLFPPDPLHVWAQKQRRAANLSKEREYYLITENRYRAIVLNQISPHSPTDWHFKRLTYMQFLFEMIKECDRLALRTDRERLLLEVLAIKQAGKRKTAPKPTEPNHPDAEGFTEVNPKETRYHTDPELTDAETAELVRQKITDFEKAKAVKKAMKSFSDTDRTRTKVSNQLTKKMGAGWSESTIKPYYAALNAAWEIQNPSPITVKW